MENDKLNEYIFERIADLLDEHAQRVYDQKHVIKERDGDITQLTNEYAAKIILIVKNLY